MENLKIGISKYFPSLFLDLVKFSTHSFLAKTCVMSLFGKLLPWESRAVRWYAIYHSIFYLKGSNLILLRPCRLLILWIRSIAVISRMGMNSYHFLPESFVDALMWYILSLISRKITVTIHYYGVNSERVVDDPNNRQYKMGFVGLARWFYLFYDHSGDFILERIKDTIRGFYVRSDVPIWLM